MRSAHAVLAVTVLVAACGGKAEPKPAPQVGPAAPVRPVPLGALHRVEVNGTALTYRLTGDSGPPLVFIHGSLADFTSWNVQESMFAHSYRVLVYSRRYHRPNPLVDDAEAYSPKLHAEDLAALMLRLELGPAHVVGVDYGAYVALALAQEHPALVRSLVLAEPPITSLLSNIESGETLRREYLAQSLDPARSAFAHGDSLAGLRAFLTGIGGVPAGYERLLVHTFELRREMLTNREQYLMPVSCAELGRLNTAVMLVRGQRSPRMFQVISDEMARCLRNDTTATIPGAGHAPPPQASTPSYFNALLARFFAGR
jgi:pimeloyl-ACP methyl ester carboxylesterase